jgi:hypothetical protein
MNKVYIVTIENWDYNGDFRELKSIDKVFDNIDDARKYCRGCEDDQRERGNKHDTRSYDIEEFNVINFKNVNI